MHTSLLSQYCQVFKEFANNVHHDIVFLIICGIRLSRNHFHIIPYLSASMVSYLVRVIAMHL